MKHRLRSLIRLHRLQLEERRRILGQLQAGRVELARQGRELEDEIVSEQQFSRTGEAGMAYGIYALTAIDRRHGIASSIDELETRMDAARDEVAEAFQEVKKFEIAADRSHEREQLEHRRRSQQNLDEISLNMHRRAIANRD